MSKQADVAVPVLAALRARRESNSLPMHRDDNYRIALAVDGGGMRGIVSAAMLSGLRDLGYANSFDALYGVSAGAINSAYFILGDGWPALTVYYDQMTTRSFIDWRRLLTRTPLVSVSFIIDEVMKHRYPLDYQKVVESPVPLYVILTSLEDRSWRAVRAADSFELQENLRASASVPLAAGRPVTVKGRSYVDGAVSLAHPALAAIAAKNYTHLVVLRTRANVTPSEQPSLSRRAYNTALGRVDKGLVAAYQKTHAQYVRLDNLLHGRGLAEGVPDLLDISCAAGDHKVGPTTQNMALLMRGMRAGYAAAHQALGEKPGRTLIRPAIERDQ